MKPYPFVYFVLMLAGFFLCASAMWIYLFRLKRKRDNKQLREIEHLKKQVAEQSKEIARLHCLIVGLEQNDETKNKNTNLNNSFLAKPSLQMERMRNKINEMIQQPNLNEEEWQKIEQLIDCTSNNFSSKLSSTYNMLSKEEVRILSLMHIGIDNDQIASFYNILPASFATRRYRIIKKMGVKDVGSISQFVKELFKCSG